MPRNRRRSTSAPPSPSSATDGSPTGLWPALLGETTAAATNPSAAWLTAPEDLPSAPPPPAPPAPPEHLEIHDLIGVGGMGEVWRATDRRLGCDVALKVIKDALCRVAPGGRTQSDVDLARDRFEREARLTARLQHPGIVPVHEYGHLQDGRPYYTMKIVSRQSLKALINAHHLRPLDGGPEVTQRQLLHIFHRCCEAVGYAHQQGVLHRDLKPENIRVGEHGEVAVLDWGIAQEMDPHPAGSGRAAPPDRWGTRAFQPPERLGSAPPPPRPGDDVYALGVILHLLLTHRLPDPEGRIPASGAADNLQAICARALAADPAARHPHADALAREIGAWLDGERRRDDALRLLARADEMMVTIQEHRRRSASARAEAAARVDGREPPWPEPVCAEVWALEDEAEAEKQSAELLELSWVQTLHATFTHVPDLPEAHARLADYYQGLHERAERNRDERRAARWEVLLRSHARARHQPYIQGLGSFSLQTDPPGAAVRLLEYRRQDRRLVAQPVAELGPTPLLEHPLPRGSYLLEITAPGCHPVHHPLLIERLKHLGGPDPEARAPARLRLPRLGELGPEDCLITPGWTHLGGDLEAVNPAPRKHTWIAGFVMRRYPVTNRAYLAFLNDLLATGQETLARRCLPREAEQEASAYFLRDGRVALGADAQGDLWDLDWPVMQIDFHAAASYAAWLAAREGLPWRLPREDEWERAARGADGRAFPWGNFLYPTFACHRHSHGDRPARPVSVYAFPLDESPFGVRGLGGNVRDWCVNVWGTGRSAYESFEALRGGYWSGHAHSSRGASRGWTGPDSRANVTGFRLVRDLPVG